MTQPTVKVITDHCTREGANSKQAKAWAKFMHGLDWDTIKPLTQMALASNVHPALAAGMVIRSTQDENVRDVLTAHLEAKAEETRND